MEADSNKRKIEMTVEPPQCKCGKLAVERTVKKSGINQGRMFYSCPSNPQCKNAFWWKDDWVKQQAEQPPTKKIAFVRGDASEVVSKPTIKLASRSSPHGPSTSTKTPVEYTKMVKPVPSQYLEPEEEHVVFYKTIMNEEYNPTNSPHILSFAQTAKKHGYNTIMAKNFDVVHHNRHMKVTKGEFDEIDDFTVMVQPYRSFTDESNYVISLQIHGQRVDDEGWLKQSDAKKIAFELPKQFLIFEKSLLRVFASKHVDAGVIKPIGLKENKGSPLISSGDATDFKTIKYGLYKVNGTYNELYANVYLEHVLQFLKETQRPDAIMSWKK
jgi:hypothetical protein